MTTILKTEGLNKTYRLGGFINRLRINALDEVNLNVESDEPVIVSLVGESGSGKTTLARVVLRMIEPSSGRAIIYDQLVAGAEAVHEPQVPRPRRQGAQALACRRRDRLDGGHDDGVPVRARIYASGPSSK